MGFKKFLNGAEYASLGLSVVGTIAAATTQQVAYAATPFTLLYSLNLLNRKEESAKSNQRLVQLEQRFSNDVRSISEQIQTVRASVNALPPSPTVTQLQEIKSLVQNNQQEIDRLEIGFRDLEVEIDNLPQPPEPVDLAWVRESIEQLRNQSNNLIKAFDRRPELDRIEKVVGNIKVIADVLEKFQDRSNSFATFESIDRLQKQLNYLTERLNNKLDSQEIEPLKTKLIRAATIEQLEEIRGEFSKFVTPEILAEFKVEIESIEQQILEVIEQKNAQTKQILLDVNNLLVSRQSVDLTEIEESIVAIQSQLSRPTPTIEQIQQIQQEITSLRDELSLLDDLEHSASALHDYHLETRNRINALETTLDREVTNVEARIKDYIDGFSVDLFNHFDSSLNNFSEKTQNITHEQLEGNIDTINQLLKERLSNNENNYNYELVLNRDGSRQVLLETLRTAKERVILVCPWLSYGIDEEVIKLCIRLLDNDGKIDVGWGHLNDLGYNIIPRQMSRQDFLVKSGNKKGKNRWKSNSLQDFENLEAKYPQQFKLKLLLTHEKFLVCDRAFAMIGSHNFLTSNTQSKEREIGLKTNNSQVVADLIKHFDNATDYEIKNIDNDFYSRNKDRLAYI